MAPSEIVLSDKLAQAFRDALEATRQINDCVKALRDMRVATTLVEHDGRWFLSAKAILSSGDVHA